MGSGGHSGWSGLIVCVTVTDVAVSPLTEQLSPVLWAVHAEMASVALSGGSAAAVPPGRAIRATTSTSHTHVSPRPRRMSATVGTGRPTNVRRPGDH